MKIPCNLYDVKEITNLPSGVYSVRCIEIPSDGNADGFVRSSKQGTLGIRLAIQFLDPGTELAPGVPRVWGRGMCDNEVTLWRSGEMGWQHFKIKEACEAFGVHFDETGFDSEHFLNAEAKIGVGVENYTKKDGKPGEKNTLEHWLKP